MNTKSFSICFDCFDICFWISTFIVPIATFVIIRLFRPNLEIKGPIINKSEFIKVTILNNSNLFAAINLRIEVCLYNEKLGYTFHLAPDHTDFLILPCKGINGNRDNKKTFVCRTVADSALIVLNEGRVEMLNNSDALPILLDKLNDGYKIRVRCHAYHSFSGLGKAFEKQF